MPRKIVNDLNTKHRFLDESGDTSFYGKHLSPLIGIKDGVSLSFLIGMVKFKSDLQTIRQQINALENKIIKDPYYADDQRIQTRAKSVNGFYFHASDDPFEVRKTFFDFLKQIDFSYECVVGRKIPSIFLNKHHRKEDEFYADLLSHLLKNKLALGGDLILNVAARGNCTKNSNLQRALQRATDRFHKRNTAGVVQTCCVFNVQYPYTEPLLCVPDYLGWAVQRVFEKGELRYYNFMEDKISLVVDIYDTGLTGKNKNYYKTGNLLTPLNKLSPPSY